MTSNDEYQNRDFWDQSISNKQFEAPIWIPYKEWCFYQYWMYGESAEIPQQLKDEFRTKNNEQAL